MEEPAKLTQPRPAGCSWDSRRAPVVKQLQLDANSLEKITPKFLKPTTKVIQKKEAIENKCMIFTKI